MLSMLPTTMAPQRISPIPYAVFPVKSRYRPPGSQTTAVPTTGTSDPNAITVPNSRGEGRPVTHHPSAAEGPLGDAGEPDALDHRLRSPIRGGP